ncbi:hypothetical protein BDB00DRAFT_858377, partial [Zychaea mexicana]|uniref:uncharacterized protein n=1 Tax=Zychaea mexicana TaxID=64656 RepID=UPI0022FE487B
MATPPLGLIVAYVAGGFTFFPVVLLILYIVHKVSAFGTWTVQQAAYEGDPKYAAAARKATSNNASISTSTILSSLSSSPLSSSQSYKVGWLRVSRDEQRLPPPDASIGDMVKNIIIAGNNRNNEQNEIYFAALKHTTLFLYDSERQLDCKGVIQVNQHRVMTHPPGLHDHELFTRPHLIKLTHKDKDSHYYINCSKCIDKEDWYLALLRAARSSQEDEESMHFDQEAMNKLLTTIHSDEHHFQTQWFNAMLGRIFCAFYKTDAINDHLYKKLISKLDKLNARRPPFLGEITVRSVDVGHAPPFLTQPRLLGLSPTGALTAEANLQYEGGIRFEIETVLKWKYSEHLRPLTVDLVLAITLKSLRGKFLLKIKEPPTNRFWYGFYELPKMEWLVEPLVGERRVEYSMVVKAIQTKIDELVMENVVLPNLDDITFFPTNGAGGIFGSATSAPPAKNPDPPEEISPTPTAAATHKAPVEPSASLPELFDNKPDGKPKMRRWFTSKDSPMSTPAGEVDDAGTNDDADDVVASPRPLAKMTTSLSDSARGEKHHQRSFIDAILNRKPTAQQQQQQKQKREKQNITKTTTASSPTAFPNSIIPTVAISSSPDSLSSSSASSSSDPPSSSIDSSSSLLQQDVPPPSKHPLPIPIITTDVEQYDDSDHDYYDTATSRSMTVNTASMTTDSDGQQRQLRLRKSASLARLKAKSMASTAVSQINVSPKMYQTELVVHRKPLGNNNNNNNNKCTDAATVISSVHQSALPSLVEKPVVSI